MNLEQGIEKKKYVTYLNGKTAQNSLANRDFQFIL